jgi:4-hydroxyphenylpyruvate dioxygenase
MAATQAVSRTFVDTKQKMGIENIDHVHLLVGNAFQAMHFFQSRLGFTPVGYQGLETGHRDHISYAMVQGNIRIVITSSMNASSSIAHEVRLHGDGVKDIAVGVEDAERCFHLALLRGACPVEEPVKKEDESGHVVTASVRSVVGHITHTFVQRAGRSACFLPDFQPFHLHASSGPLCLVELDHLALTVPAGQLEEAVSFYTSVFDLNACHAENIVTVNSAMNTKVVQNERANVRFPIMEPGAGRRSSQIEEYLRYNGGPGIQHLAFACHDIIEGVRHLQESGVAFLETPSCYYDMLGGRIGSISQDIESLRALSILVDRDEWGHLLQIFTKPITGRPTLFFELIQREGAKGFGSGNIRALFAAVEREQAVRGNL